MPDNVDTLDTVSFRGLGRYNRRTACRYLCHLASPARVSGAGEVWRLAWVHDLSVSGIGLLLGGPVEPGMEMDIELLTPDIARTSVRGRVVHATRRDDGSWLVGCVFHQSLNRTELERLL